MKRALWLLPPLLLAALGYWALRAVPVPSAPVVPAGPARPHPQGDLLVGPFPEPHHLNPFTTEDAVARRHVLRYTHDALLELDPASGALRPALAEAVERSSDGARCVFTLRENVRFADGAPLSIDDVLFTHAAATDAELPAGALGQALALVDSAAALDARRLEVVLREPTARAFERVATGWWVMRARWLIDAVQARARAGGEPEPRAPGEPGFARWLAQLEVPGPGTGPYAIAPEAWRRGLDLTLAANPQSWRRTARPDCWNLAGLRLRFVTDPAAQLVALRRQELDWMLDQDPDARLAADPELAARYRALVYDHQDLGRYAVIWNHRRPGLGDPRVRRALARLFDRTAIARDLMGGHAWPAAAWFRPGLPEHPDDIAPEPYDPAAARAELAAAGFDPAGGRPLALALTYAAGDDLQQRIVELARPAFARAGVELALRPAARAVWFEQLRARDFDALLAVLGLDPYEVFHSAQRESGNNWMGYADPAVDRLLEGARAAPDDAERHALQRELCRLLARDQPLAVLVHPRVAVLLHRRFRGVAPGALGLVPERWWVDAADQLHR